MARTKGQALRMSNGKVPRKSIPYSAMRFKKDEKKPPLRPKKPRRSLRLALRIALHDCSIVALLPFFE